MRKIIGIALIICGGLLGAKLGCNAIRAKTACLRELAQALRKMKGEITLHRKLPDALCTVAQDTKIGAAFHAIARQIRQSPLTAPTLDEAALPPQAQTILTNLLPLLGGAEVDCLAAVDAAISQAETEAETLAAQERDQIRVCRTMWLSGAAVAAILLG